MVSRSIGYQNTLNFKVNFNFKVKITNKNKIYIVPDWFPVRFLLLLLLFCLALSIRLFCRPSDGLKRIFHGDVDSRNP